MTVRRLARLLGHPYTVARISTANRAPRVERAWECGCQASSGSVDKTTYWFPCSRHEVTVLTDGRDVEPAGSAEDVGSFLASRLVENWQAPAIALGVAFVAKSVFDSLSLVKRAEEAEGASLVDPLTGLYNRRGWDRRVVEERKRLKRDTEPVVAVYMLDVDGLKATNDERGHSAGDAILRNVAKVIREVTREHDIAARLGGDEFAILTVQSQAAEADLIRARLERGFASATLSVSIGFAFANSVDTIEKAMDQADSAMYEVKKRNAHSANRR